MATKQLTGSWQLAALDSNGNEEMKHDLAVPLQSIMLDSFDQAWGSESADGTSFATLQLGDSLEQRRVTIKYENQFKNLLVLLRKGIVNKQDIEIRDGRGNVDTVKIVEPVVENFGRDMFEKSEFFKTYREINFTMTVRKVNGNDFVIPELRGPNSLLFEYHAGEETTDATFSRSSTATYREKI